MFPRKNCFSVGPAKRRTSETEAFKLEKHKYTVSKAGCNLTGAGTEQAAAGVAGGLLLAAVHQQLNNHRLPMQVYQMNRQTLRSRQQMSSNVMKQARLISMLV